MLPAPTSPASGVIPEGTTLNGVSVCPGTDQRGVSRPQPASGKCTIGSVEVAPQAGPSFSSATGTTFTVGQPGSFTVESYANPMDSLTEAGSLPSGVIFTANDNGTATIAGTPASGTRGSYPITITATNSNTSVTQSFTLYVQQSINTLYVAQGGTDSGSCMSSSSPCATISYALTQAGAGDTIEVSGSIDDNVDVSIPITITGAEAPASSPAIVDSAAKDANVIKVAPGVDAIIDDLTMEGATGGVLSGGGSGLENSGNTILENSTATGNSAAFGGGISNVDGGSLTIADSTVSDNTAGVAGAGILNEGGTLTVTDSTIAGNNADAGSGEGGGILNVGLDTDEGTVAITDSTVADNTAATGLGGGIDDLAGGLGTETTIGASIVAANAGGNCAGTAPTSVGYNLTDDTTGTDCGFTQPTDIVDQSPDLGALGNNGGSTSTLAPASGSPAVDVIPPAALAVVGDQAATLCPGMDQRGVSRPGTSGSKCTIGAVELAPTNGQLTTSPASGLTFGKSVTLTDRLSSGISSPSLPPPAGTVTFDLGGSPIAGCAGVTVSSGTASCTPTSLPPGTSTVTAIYGGTNGYLGQVATLSLTVNRAKPAIKVTSSVNPAKVGQTVTYSTTILATVTPTGTVTFTLGGTPVAGCDKVALSASGTATCSASYTSAGRKKLTVSYSGDTDFRKASTTFKEKVTGSAPLTIISTGLASGTVGSAYSETLKASGGKTPYAWKIEKGSLPAGLKLKKATGVIKGTPTTAGTSSFRVEVTDSANPNHTATKALSIKVAGASNETAPYTLSCSLDGTAVDVPAVVTTGTLPASVASGASFSMTKYTMKFSIPDTGIFAGAAGLTISGSIATGVTATGATPASQSTTLSIPSTSIPSPMPSSGVPVTATGTNLRFTAGSKGTASVSTTKSGTLTINVNGSPIALSCTNPASVITSTSVG
jgi:large repetitive protein